MQVKWGFRYACGHGKSEWFEISCHGDLPLVDKVPKKCNHRNKKKYEIEGECTQQDVYHHVDATLQRIVMVCEHEIMVWVKNYEKNQGKGHTCFSTGAGIEQ